MLESKIQADIRKALIRAGWLVIRPLAFSEPGYPDLWVIRRGQLVCIEVKQPGKKPTRLQEYRIRKLCDAGIEAIVATSVRDVEHMVNEKSCKGG